MFNPALADPHQEGAAAIARDRQRGVRTRADWLYAYDATAVGSVAVIQNRCLFSVICRKQYKPSSVRRGPLPSFKCAPLDHFALASQ